jgi:hypothetical protein
MVHFHFSLSWFLTVAINNQWHIDGWTWIPLNLTICMGNLNLRFFGIFIGIFSDQFCPKSNQKLLELQIWVINYV